MNYQLATLFGLGRLPGGGTWASLFVLIVAYLFYPHLQLYLFALILFFIFETIRDIGRKNYIK